MDSEPLISPSHLRIGFSDHLGRPINRFTTGRWNAALFIIGVEMAERFAYVGVASNLITYLTGPLGESTATAAASVNTWDGFALIMPLLGGFLADSYLGRYRTIIFASLIYILGLGMLTLSSILPPSWAHSQVILFYGSLYMVAIAQGFHKPCVQAFGADQFDQNDPEECISRRSFFNWWFFGVSIGSMLSYIILSYVQDSISWVLGFGIPCFLMVVALVVFMMGNKTYRYYILEDRVFAKFGRAFTNLVRNRGDCYCDSKQRDSVILVGAGETQSLHASYQSKLEENVGMPSIGQTDRVKEVLRLFPVWATCLTYGISIAQAQTFFTKQGSTMDRRIFSHFQVSPAALQSLICLSLIILIPIYDRILVPIFTRFSKRPSGITLLQRIGIGIFLSVIYMVIAALVEMKRLQTAKDFGLVDIPNATIPMSLWWLVPQYILFGMTEVFAMIGLQEFFYDQIPDSLRSLGLALYLSIFGIGSFISSFLISMIDKVTGQTGHESWFPNNLNRAHLDYFYWLLAGLNALGLLIYLLSAQAYVYKKKGNGAV